MTDPLPTTPLPGDDPELDLTAPLPTGTTVLEASAGTGKTYAIAALATRAVAEGVCTLPQLLIVTFTRAATAELRDRVRRRLVGAASHLDAAVAADDAGRTRPPADGDVVLAHLATGTTDGLRVRRDRLDAALTEFDAATISTIHGFTQQVLRSVGLSADVPRDVALTEDTSSLVDEVVDDVYVRRYLGRAHVEGRPRRRVAQAIARAVDAHGDAAIRPARDDLDPAGAERAALAHDLRAELVARKRHDGVLSYDDLLLALRDALTDPVRGPQAVAVLRERYRWALVDEFQDTDPVQWDILQRAFQDPRDDGRALVLIGDPKQAIYRFRGADVRAYLDATRTASRRRRLGTNYRSDGPLLDALERLLSGTTFGEREIRFRPVTANDSREKSALADDVDDAALQLRAYAPPRGQGNAPAVRRHLAQDVAATLVEQLGRVRIGDDGRRLRPEDVAVLVRTNAEARLVHQALRDVRVPAVVNGVGSVLATDAASDWRWLLEAVEKPSDPQRIRRLALSAWIGWDATRLASAIDDDLEDLHASCHRWSHVLRDQGVAALERTVTTERDVAAAQLAALGGERHLTDLRHVGQLLHAAELEEERGVTSLLSWLHTACTEAGDAPTPSDEQARRLESDARAVQILTIHRSKGLEYPVVFAPFQWSAGAGVGAPVVVHDPDEGRRVVDVGPSDRPGFADTRELAQAEDTGEQLRLLYVAVTRARHRAVVWWAPASGHDRSALGRVLFGRDDHGQVRLDTKAAVPAPEDTPDALRERFRDAPASITEVPPSVTLTPWAPGDDDPDTLTVARFDRPLDRAWQRTSYSGIVRRSAHVAVPSRVATVASEPEVTPKDDEPDAHDPAGPGEVAPPAGSGAAVTAPVPLGELRGGTAFGTMVHAVLEHADFRADDLPGELARVVAERTRHHRLPGLTDADLGTLVAGLAAAVTSPLGPLAGRRHDGTWRRLADLGRRDRLDELEFELPLAGGDEGRRDGAAVALATLADLLDRDPADGGLAADDPVRRAGYADRLRTPGYHLDLRGYLTGSIDLVARVVDEDGRPRFLVADHKTNRLRWPEPPTAWDHRPTALAAAMVHHDYPLQALLYQVALHRYLRWRVPDYTPAVHLGGVLYLFLRGMVGADTPTVEGGPCGVFAWRPPAELVVATSDLLDGQLTSDPRGQP